MLGYDEIYNLLCLVIFSLIIFCCFIFNKKNTGFKRLIVILAILSWVAFFVYSLSKLNNGIIPVFVICYLFILMLISIVLLILVRIFIYITDGE
jgi:hypothetical protein